MNRIHIKIMSEDALAYLKTNAEYVAQKIKESESNEWIINTFPQPIFVEKKSLINDFELVSNPDSKNREIDFDNSRTLFENLNELPRYILCDERFWLWLHFDKFYSIVRNMMQINGKSTVENMWMHTQGTRRGLMFGVLSRCFFRVFLSVDDSLEDKYELTKWVIENPERYRNLTWRSFSSETHLVRGILKGEKKAIDENPSKERTAIYPEIGKYVSVIGSVRLLDAISEEDISAMIYGKVKELIGKGAE
ncbi:MAG TPA: DUF6339 family protein [Bacilli bacterium]|nr:DUF6339 family protein [Bacilli bacterium]